MDHGSDLHSGGKVRYTHRPATLPLGYLTTHPLPPKGHGTKDTLPPTKRTWHQRYLLSPPPPWRLWKENLPLWSVIKLDGFKRVQLYMCFQEHRNVSCNVCGQQLPKSDLWLRNFDQDLKILGKHYDSHLMEDGGIPVHGYRCRWVA